MVAVRASRRGVGVLVVVAVLLVAAVLLTRGSTATRVDLAPSPEPGVEPTGAPRVAADGVAGARIGQGLSANDSRWSTRPDIYGSEGCTLVDPMFSAGLRGSQLMAWAVRGRILSVVVGQAPDSIVSPVALPNGLTMGDDLDDAAGLPGAEVTTERFDVPVGPGFGVDGDIRELRAVTVAGDDHETVYSDLGGDRGIVYVEVRDPAAPDCRLVDPAQAFLPPEVADLRPDGIGEARVGRSVEELVRLGLVEPTPGDRAASCPVHMATDAGWETGIERVTAPGGVVTAVTARVARTDEGLAVGDEEAAVLRVYPDAEPRAGLGLRNGRWETGLPGDRRLVVGTGPRAVVPESVDYYLSAAEPQVWSLTVEVGGCDA